ncbi:hypothetical protein E2562_020796 [Oryza meyeriana var. granulata]|uniref:Uncharacterized protein n=1 Tax=Oryza meyeriana var. granulata TaxID=110450 RepID=A0A6G1CIM7_9ORYZ|nr:hypothetical protein E2562_020796 [Oryza meyeriana var. granulata]
MPMAPEQQLQEDDDDFTFPTAPQPRLFATGHHLPCSSPPVWLLSSPIRRSFSAADCAGSPWRNAHLVLRRHATGGGACSPALSDYAGGFCDGEDEEEEEEEERMDSLWEDLNDDDAAVAAAGGTKKGDVFLASLDVSRRRSVGGLDLAEKRKKKPASSNEGDGGAALGASRSSRRRAPGLVAMMRSLKKMLVAHKAKSKVHKSDDHTTASASASSSCGNFAKK